MSFLFTVQGYENVQKKVGNDCYMYSKMLEQKKVDFYRPSFLGLNTRIYKKNGFASNTWMKLNVKKNFKRNNINFESLFFCILFLNYSTQNVNLKSRLFCIYIHYFDVFKAQEIFQITSNTLKGVEGEGPPCFMSYGFSRIYPDIFFHFISDFLQGYYNKFWP